MTKQIDPRHPAILPLMRYCAYQERCLSEVRAKMELLEVPQAEWADLISLLEEENFLNEERFAHAYVRGKHRHNGWGRAKIRFNLRQKGVPPHFISQALVEELPDSLYLQTLQSKLESRLKTLKPKDDVYTQKQKLAHYLSQLGYESELVWSAINQLGLK